MAIEQRQQQAIQQRREQHLYRQRQTLEGPQDRQLQIDGRSLLNFCSNDYLGLANHAEVKAAAQQAIEQYGVGSGASHLVCGHHQLHHQLEQALAQWLGRERVLLFSSGYMANLALITSLVSRGDYVFEDRLNHASLLDGGLFSGARFQRYRHLDFSHLEQLLQQAGAGEKLIVTDSVFSMDGDLADIAALAALAQHYNATLMVDDAHAIGVLGGEGGGSIDLFALDQQQLPLLMGTLGKAFGVYGAFVAGTEAMIDSLIQFARPYIYTTALPPALAAASLASLRIIREQPQRREKLQQLIRYFRQQAEQSGLPLMPSSSAIQPLLIGDSEQALAISAQLHQAGCLVTAIRPPTVPANTARLRVTLTAEHSEQDIDTLISALAHSGIGTVSVP